MRATSRSKSVLARTPVVRRVFRNPLVDADWYRATYEDVRLSGTNPATHYALFGWHESRDPNPLFDTDWYLARYVDVRDSGTNPLDHYLRHGAYEGRDPGPYFDSAWYLDENPDVRASGLNPLLHYLAYGHGEGRKPRAYLDSDQPQPSTGIRPGGMAWAALVTLQRRRNASALSRSNAARRQPVVSRSELVRLFGDLEAAALPHDARVAVPWATTDSAPSAPFDWTPFPAPGGYQRPALVSSTSAIAQLEWQRHEGVTHVAIPDSAQPWLDDLSGMRAHLDRYPTVAGLDGGQAYDLRQRADASSSVVRLRALADEFRDRELRNPVVLDLWSGFDFRAALPGIQTFLPPVRTGAPYPYADSSVAFVGFDDADEESRVEARRIASHGVFAVSIDRSSRAWDIRIDALEQSRASDLPSVSIVVPTHNGVELIRRCLAGLAETIPGWFQAEAIVVDDGSHAVARDALVEIVEGHRAARLVTSDTNLGYVGATNLGAQTATGSLIVLLNDDTLPLPGWLSALVRTVRERPDAGAVAARLVYPDGRLQEAGGVIFSDASGANFGRHAIDPDAPEFSYVREVDYASGAALITPATVFRSLGGLDPIYGFGYYEDADYAFRLRREGLKTLYQPKSVVIHIEGATAGTDTTTGPKSYQVANRSVFMDRFAAELASQPQPPAEVTTEGLAALADRAGR